jgi:hypothetical protein
MCFSLVVEAQLTPGNKPFIETQKNKKKYANPEALRYFYQLLPDRENYHDNESRSGRI